jgi:glycosyltransferase involved in cell wall biosynthesis
VLIAGRVEAGANDYFEQLKASGSPNIRWVGEQDVRKFLPKLDVFVMVSEPAGCPNASLEAMASGLPIIATDVGGANEQVITGKNGWLVRPRNSKALRRAAEEALQLKPSELRKLACGSLKKVRSFSLKQMVQGYEGLFTIRGKGKT